MELLNIYFALPAFALVLARVAGLALSVPMFSGSQIPIMIKLALVVPLSMMIFPVVMPMLPESLTLGQAAAGMLGEFLVGEMIGFGAGMVFLATQVAGKVVSHQSGFALGQVFNPLLDEQNTILDQIWFFTTLMIFMMLRGHVAVIRTLLGSFNQIPPMMLVTDVSMVEFIIAVLRNAFDLAVRLAGPTVLALLLTSLIMGLMTKTVPQINILSVGFTFKIAAALIVLALTMTFFGPLVVESAWDSLDMVGVLLERMSDSLMARMPGGGNLAG